MTRWLLALFIFQWITQNWCMASENVEYSVWITWKILLWNSQRIKGRYPLCKKNLNIHTFKVSVYVNVTVNVSLMFKRRMNIIALNSIMTVFEQKDILHWNQGKDKALQKFTILLLLGIHTLLMMHNTHTHPLSKTDWYTPHLDLHISRASVASAPCSVAGQQEAFTVHSTLP